MSVGTVPAPSPAPQSSTAPGLVPNPGGFAARSRRSLPLRAGTARIPLRAFVYSRLIALLAGAAGVLTTVKHDPISSAATLRHLGPAGYLLAGSVDRFDSGYYLDIANHGFGAVTSGRLAFFPLYPLVIRVLTPFTGSDVLAGALISAASFAAALVLLHRMTEFELGRPAADATVLLLAFAPLSFFFTAVYTESIFLLLSVGAVYAARRGRWVLAGLLGGLAALTRPTGILLVVPLAIAALRHGRRLDRRVLWSLAPLAAIGSYMAVLGAAGLPPLAPFTAQAHWQRISVGPVFGFATGIAAALRGLGTILRGGASIYAPTSLGPLSESAQSILLLLVLLVAAGLAARCFRRLPLEYGAYAALALAMCVSSPQVGQPLVSLDRYVLTIFPLWMVAGRWVARRGLLRPTVVIGSLLLAFYTVQFSSWSFIA